MPRPPRPVVDPLFGRLTPLVYDAQLRAEQTAALAAGATQGNLVDQYGNTVEVSGTNLNQIVIIGAAFSIPGVQVGTGIANGTPGRAVQQGLATGTITCTANTNTATLDSTISGTFINGLTIGAANVDDPSSGLATPAIVPGTTMTISGSTITLTPPSGYMYAVQENGSGIYCCACLFSLLT